MMSAFRGITDIDADLKRCLLMTLYRSRGGDSLRRAPKLSREVSTGDPMACGRRARQCMHLAQMVGPGEVKRALLAIAKAWAKLAIQVNACKASEVG